MRPGPVQIDVNRVPGPVHEILAVPVPGDMLPRSGVEHGPRAHPRLGGERQDVEAEGAGEAGRERAGAGLGLGGEAVAPGQRVVGVGLRGSVFAQR